MLNAIKKATLLNEHAFLAADQESLLDIALMPFVRQFSKVERQWYQQSPYPKLRAWLNAYLQSPMFTKIMAKHELWVENHQDIILYKELTPSIFP